MAYAALLFCPDEKTARTVTQVLAELEFGVEPCSEPFGAVKKLMSQHFDAIVVDCDNEQNATLLFKSARNSTSNQASLAVAIVEGQAGVAKAFRIGANLVLTKPINVEQSKGTLRVARGLLRKGETGKPAAAPAMPVATPAAAAPKPLPTKLMSAAKRTAAAATGSRETSEANPGAIPHAAAKTASAAAAQIPSSAAGSPAPTPVSKAAGPAPSASPSTLLLPSSSGGAASAPAPAREAQVSETAPAAEPKDTEAANSDEPKASSAGAAEPALSNGDIGVPSFTFGGANAEPSSGAGKKIVFGLIAAIVIAAAAYAGWTYFGHRSQSAAEATTPTAVAPLPQPAVQPATPSRTGSAGPLSHPAFNAAEDGHGSTKAASDELDEVTSEKSAHSPKASGNPSAASVDDTSATEPETAAPLVVKSGKKPHAHSDAAADAPAPSVIGMATPDSEAPLSGLVADQPTTKPVLEKMKVSQGVAQGLIIKRVAPDYPKNALMMKIQGAVELAATISKDGEIKDVKVLSGNSQLTHAAVQAVKQWKYKPYLLNGEPVEIQTQIVIDFKLPQ